MPPETIGSSSLSGELNTPATLFLPDNSPIVVHISGRDYLLQNPFNPQERCLATGRFSEALQHLINGNAHDDAMPAHLDILERQNRWLTGLSSATTTCTEPATLLTGSQLGILFIELTSQCNEHCIHCYAESSPQCHDFLGIDEIRTVLDEARKLGAPLVQFTGGDPLIHRNLVDAVTHANSLGFAGIEIYTNGLLLTDHLLDQLIPYRPSFAFSLYSHLPETHDAITQVPGSHAKTLAAIRKTRESGLSLRIGATQMKENAGHEAGLIELLEQRYDIDRADVRFEPIRRSGRGDFYDYTPPRNIERAAHLPRMVETDTQEGAAANSETGMPGRKGKLCIAANGDIYPCIFARKTVLGNIRRQRLPDALQQLAIPERNPSAERWKRCHEGLQCADCQLMAYLLGDA